MILIGLWDRFEFWSAGFLAAGAQCGVISGGSAFDIAALTLDLLAYDY
jgi:hypothetical protein